MDDEVEQKDPAYLSSLLGWFVLAGAIFQAPVLILGVAFGSVSSSGGKYFSYFATPMFLLFVAAGIGLILRRMWGYYVLYAAAILAGVTGGRIVFIPFVQQSLKLGPMTGDVFLVLNLVVLGVLAWEHWGRIWDLEPEQQVRNRVAFVSLVSLAFLSYGFGRAMIDNESGQVASAAELPVAGERLSSFQTKGPIDFYSVHTLLLDGLTMVLGGTSTEEAVKAFAEEHSLKQMTDPAAHKKFLPQVKSWKMDAAKFPLNFGPDDLYYVGRFEGARKLSLQLCFRKSDGKFTAQIFGLLPPED